MKLETPEGEPGGEVKVTLRHIPPEAGEGWHSIGAERFSATGAVQRLTLRVQLPSSRVIQVENLTTGDKVSTVMSRVERQCGLTAQHMRYHPSPPPPPS